MEKIKTFFTKFSEDAILARSGLLAYTTALAMAPLIVLFVWALSVINPNLQGEMVKNVGALIGEDGAQLARTIISGANDRPDLSSLSGWLGLFGLIFSASFIFGQIQDTLNVIFKAPEHPHSSSDGSPILAFLKDRLFSIGILLAFVFLAIFSLILSSMISYFLPSSEEIVMKLFLEGVNLGVFALLFAVIYKWMPDQTMTFRQCIIGGALTAVLFVIGKTALSFYMEYAAVGSAYGAAGSLVVLLVWVYYSSLIFFLGAEVTDFMAPSLQSES